MKKLKSLLFSCCLFMTFVMMAGCEGTQGKEVEGTPTPVPTQKIKIETLAIYSINSDNMTLIPVSVRKGSQKLSPSYVAGLVMENLNEENIAITDIYQKGKKVIVSFDPDGKPVKNCTAKMETLILEAFANSLLDNVKNCSQVIFRCDGKEYKSDQYSFGLNEVFASE